MKVYVPTVLSLLDAAGDVMSSFPSIGEARYRRMDFGTQSDTLKQLKKTFEKDKMMETVKRSVAVGVQGESGQR